MSDVSASQGSEVTEIKNPNIKIIRSDKEQILTPWGAGSSRVYGMFLNK